MKASLNGDIGGSEDQACAIEENGETGVVAAEKRGVPSSLRPQYHGRGQNIGRRAGWRDGGRQQIMA